MPSWKKVIVSGSDALLNTLTVTNGITGSLQGTASYATNADFLDGRDSSVFATTGSNIFVGNQTVTGSLFTTGSNTLIGSTSLTGSLNISGSETIAGYIQFEPVTTNINTAISASYIYVSGSTNDLYFSQNSKGYSNTTRLRWLEGNLYTGLLHGGLITTQSSTVYQISSGSGIIVDLNASLSDDPYPVIQFLQWGNLSASIAPFTASYQQAFVGIDSTNNIFAQGTPFSNGQFSDIINIGNVLFQNQSTINGVKTQPSVAYGFEQQQNTFNRAFGPLKLSGYTLAPSGSSTGSLIVGSGTAYAPGSNYSIDPNDPSYTIDPGTNVSKIFRYHQSGSTWIYNTNGGAGFTVIDPTQYSNNGVLTAVPGGAGADWSIQRVFYFPNSVTKAIVVYYGNAIYDTEAEARGNIDFESFVEAPNTAANAIYLGAIIVRSNFQNWTQTTRFTIYPGGLFRQVGGSGGGGSIITQTLAGLSDVLISGPTDGQALVYDNTAAKWENKSSISASITGNAATATTASYALTSSNIQGGNQYYVPLWDTNTSLTSSYLNQSGSVLKAIYNGADKGLTLDYNFDSFILGNAGTGNNTYFQVFDGGSTINVYSSNYTYFNDKVGVRIIPTNPGLAVSGSLEVTGPGTVKFMGTNAQITGSLTVTGGITGSLFGTASWAENSITASYVLNAVSASYAANALSSSYAITASHALNANTASYVLNALSASFATSASIAQTATTASFVTASNVFGPFGSNSIISSSYALTASFALNGGGGGGSNPAVTHTQLTASTTWSFNHNLNTQTPLLQVYDLGYEQIIPNEIVSIDAFTSEIRFDYTQAGYAVASSGGGLIVTGSTARLIQTVAATTWSFQHNLGTKYPGFEIFNSNDDVIIPAGIHAVDTDNAEIYFATPSTGIAIANFSGISGSFENTISASYAATSSYSDAFNIGQTLTRYATVTSSINGSNTIFTQATGSYTSAFFKYTVTSGSNARSGEIMSVWNGTTAAFTDNSTTDIGTTTDVTSSVEISGANVQLNMQTNSSGWRIKSIATFM